MKRLGLSLQETDLRDWGARLVQYILFAVLL